MPEHARSAARTRSSTSHGSVPPLVSHRTTTSAPPRAAASQRRERVAGVVARSRRRSARRRRSRAGRARAGRRRCPRSSRRFSSSVVRRTSCDVQRPSVLPKIVHTGVPDVEQRGERWRRPRRRLPARRVEPNAASVACVHVDGRARARSSSTSLGFEPGQPPSMKRDAERVELLRDAQLVVARRARCPRAACRRAAWCRRSRPRSRSGSTASRSCVCLDLGVERQDVAELVEPVEQAAAARTDRSGTTTAVPSGSVDALAARSTVSSSAGRPRARARSRVRPRSSATGRRPFFSAFCLKMSANERAITARKPQSTSAHGACSRDEPQPKLSPARRICAPAASGRSSGKSGVVRQSANRPSPRPALSVTLRKRAGMI